MVLIKCYVRSCNKSFASIDAIQVYFSIKHLACTYFKCVIEGCNRSFRATLTDSD